MSPIDWPPPSRQPTGPASTPPTPAWQRGHCCRTREMRRGRGGGRGGYAQRRTQRMRSSSLSPLPPPPPPFPYWPRPLRRCPLPPSPTALCWPLLDCRAKRGRRWREVERLGEAQPAVVTRPSLRLLPPLVSDCRPLQRASSGCGAPPPPAVDQALLPFARLRSHRPPSISSPVTPPLPSIDCTARLYTTHCLAHRALAEPCHGHHR